MADHNDTVEEEGVEDNTGNENEGADDTENTDTQEEGDNSSNEDGDDEGDEGEEGDDDGDDTEDDDYEPAVRKSHNQFNAGKRIASKKTKDDSSKSDDGKGDEGGDDDGIHPDDKEVIQSAVAEALKPITDKIVAEEDDKEINDFISANPEFRSYEKKARKYMAHPSRAQVPIDEVFYSVAGKDLLKIGAKRGKVADAKANKSKSGDGTSTRNAPEGKSVQEMSTKEFEAEQMRVRMGR